LHEVHTTYTSPRFRYAENYVLSVAVWLCQHSLYVHVVIGPENGSPMAINVVVLDAVVLVVIRCSKY